MTPAAGQTPDEPTVTADAPPPAPAAYPARHRYQGEVAERYLEHRAGDRKWRLEQEVMQRLIAALPPGSAILDLPIGTGRYLELYAAGGHRVVGLDISPDMLRLSRDGAGADAIAGLVRGDAAAIPLRDGAVDYVVSTRLMNWFPAPVFARAVAELARVASRGLVLGVREVQRIALPQLPAMGRELASEPVASFRRLLRPFKERGVARLDAARRALGLPGGADRDRPPGIILHGAADVRAAFAASRLAVEDVVTIDERTAFSRRPLAYAPLRVYVLRRAA
jgi:ubiquinone/menaquinone biosynthesis C-methylase UbiE